MDWYPAALCFKRSGSNNHMYHIHVYMYIYFTGWPKKKEKKEKKITSADFEADLTETEDFFSWPLSKLVIRKQNHVACV